ncbi:ATP-dependent DNA helicase DinG [Fictibacillus phosphorivorans]|uniref:ATP-dependent DNA helicase DinG n=1 Tax=Fictibacillus phosphorivorans TaxID=1221500 RepID=UPI00204069CD|nr:ATP-dependent DNA helicase DinG [Fictibacillus phosphorivorans]MCM3718902.1 ATP-dependent DNA helicase DinG [Fictibacillus phosphorivorans]MCM3776524.1 ATP-dependent DNA helicase DinG [Fictibacillus phosphorivorans]
MTRRYVVIDFETTGNSATRGDRIIQIGAVVVEAGQITDRYSTFIQPGVPIPPFIEQLTGINDDMVKDAPLFEEVAPKLLQMLEGAYFVAHNVMFDYSFLQGELDRCGYSRLSMPLIDTVELSRLLLLGADGYQLGMLAEYLGLKHDNPHQADSDAEVTAMLLIHLLEKLKALPLMTLERLTPFLKKLQSSLENIVRDIISDKSVFLADEETYDFYRKLALKKTSKPAVNESYDALEGVDASDLEQSLQKHMTNYEIRESQQKMVELVDEALHTNQHLVIEAGTGVGKSLGYLIPGVRFAKENERPIVVSTHTVQLQQQLLERDVPLLKKIMPFDFTATLLKGRNHYLCLRKFEHTLQDHQEDNYDTNFTKAQLIIWLTETEQGDVEELSMASGGKLFWNTVKSDANSCLNHRCPWFSRCYYHKQRRAAHESDLVITNHALIFTDLKSDSQLLPSYKEAVLDEAHHIEEVVSDHFGKETDYFTFIKLLDRLSLTESEGMMNTLRELSDLLEVPKYETYLAKWDNLFQDTKNELDDLFKQIKTICLSKAKSARSSEIIKHTLRYSHKDIESALFEPVLEMEERTKQYIGDLVKPVKRLLKKFDQFEEHLTVKQKGFLVDIEGVLNDLQDEATVLHHLLSCPLSEEVYWMEAESKGPRHAVTLFAKPVEIDQILADQFFGKKSSVVLTSATMSVRNKFSYISERLGLLDFGPLNAQLPSPFKYEEQAKLMVPTDIPLINEVDQKTFVAKISTSLYEIAKVTKGRMLVLFTSYEMLKETHIAFKSMMDQEEFMLIAQGVDSGSRARLTKNFQRFDNAILFGTSSFWEGIDIPGDDLSCLVIIRLPFTPPDQPVMAAKSEKLKAEGGNPFYDLSLPQAIIRFKQGFGRLVRSSRDKGAVFVFDRRMIETRYGKSFIQSLPKLPVSIKPVNELVEELREWMD